MQDVYVRLWRMPERYVERRGNFVSWLLSVTRNRSIDEVRARGRRAFTSSDVNNSERGRPVEDNVPSEAAALEFEQAEFVDQRALVRQALTELPTDQRLAIELAYYGGLTQAEIAAQLDTPLGTVKTRIRLGMRKLRHALEGRIGVLDPETDPADAGSVRKDRATDVADRRVC